MRKTDPNRQSTPKAARRFQAIYGFSIFEPLEDPAFVTRIATGEKLGPLAGLDEMGVPDGWLLHLEGQMSLEALRPEDTQPLNAVGRAIVATWRETQAPVVGDWVQVSRFLRARGSMTKQEWSNVPTRDSVDSDAALKSAERQEEPGSQTDGGVGVEQKPEQHGTSAPIALPDPLAGVSLPPLPEPAQLLQALSLVKGVGLARKYIGVFNALVGTKAQVQCPRCGKFGVLQAQGGLPKPDGRLSSLQFVVQHSAWGGNPKRHPVRRKQLAGMMFRNGE